MHQSVPTADDSERFVARRRVLALLVVIVALGLLLLLAIPFMKSMNPSSAAKNAYEVKVPLASIPSKGFIEVDWNGNRVFLGKRGDLRVFFMPFLNGSYRLPDVTWARAHIPCSKFGFEAGYFGCSDPEIGEWGSIARWKDNGESVTEYLPPLQRPPFAVVDDSVVVGRGP